MIRSSRIQKSIANAQVNIFFYVLSVILAFFSRKYFLENLGTQFLGLSGTLGDMLNLMNITELGIGTAVGVTLYKPLFGNDKETINDIVSVFGFLYTRVGGLIAAAGVVLSCFFPIIFKDAELPLYLPYLMFYSMLYASLLGYFINYKQIILSASQQNYVINIRYQTAVIIKAILQILTSFLPYNYIWWIALEAITITIYSFVLNRTIYRYFPWLETSVARGKEKFREYRHLLSLTKNVFVFKISHLVLNSANSIFIASFANLSTVALYGNYNMLMSKVSNLFDGLFTGMGASIGNLIAEGNVDKMKAVFYELLSLRYYVAIICSLFLYFATSPIISIWLGEEYVMSGILVITLSIHVFINQARLTVTNFKDSFGFFQDIWAPIAEVVLYVLLSIVLGHHIGFVGVLMALVISEFLIKMLWQPYYLFKHGFKCSVIKFYWPHIAKYIALLSACYGLTNKISSLVLSEFNVTSWGALMLYGILIGATILILITIGFYLFDKHFKNLVFRLISYVKKR